ncbi:hypothetical protein DV736_g3219, partial [Chaetothyriales sp. CBS 134916]
MTKAVPQYPRPVPFISADEAPVCSNTVVYECWTDEAEREERERAAKRRRTITEAAASYLRGEPLFILTASLQGPFSNGWKNPWARKRQKHGDGPEIAVDTAGTEPAGRKRDVPATAGAAATEHPPSVPKKRAPTDQVVQGQNQNLSTAKRHIRSPAASASRPNSSAGKVSDWLRKTEDIRPFTAGNGHSSPTPGEKERLQPLSDSEYESAAAWRSAEAPPGQTALGQTLSFSGPFQSAGSENDRPRQPEAAIIEYKRRGHRVPRSTHLPEFEYRKPQSRRAKADEVIPDESHRKDFSEPAEMPRGQASLHPKVGVVTTAQGEQSGTATSEGHSGFKPALSNEASNVHSAQVVAAAPRLATLPSDVHSTEEMLESAPLVTANENHTTFISYAAAQQLVNTGDSEKENDRAAEERSQPGQLPAQVDDEPTTSLDKTPVRELDSSEMMAAINRSTAKKKPLNEKTAASPTPSPRVFKDTTILTQQRKKPKSISVKASMKVTKASATSTANKADSASHSLSHSQRLLQGPSPACAAAAGVVAREQTLNPSPLKGILKRISASASTSTKPDAQPVVHSFESGRQGGGDENDDSFDLDLAMDELGSYLGTWDADVEAQKLDA